MSIAKQILRFCKIMLPFSFISLIVILVSIAYATGAGQVIAIIEGVVVFLIGLFVFCLPWINKLKLSIKAKYNKKAEK